MTDIINKPQPLPDEELREKALLTNPYTERIKKRYEEFKPTLSSLYPVSVTVTLKHGTEGTIAYN